MREDVGECVGGKVREGTEGEREKEGERMWLCLDDNKRRGRMRKRRR